MRAVIHVTIRQTVQGQTEETRQVHEGKGVRKENGWYVTFSEMLEGIGDVQTVVRIGEGDVTLIRQGHLQMKQQFLKRQSSRSTYISPHGTFQMETHTRTLKITRDADRPKAVYAEYQLWLNGQYVGEFTLTFDLCWGELT